MGSKKIWATIVVAATVVMLGNAVTTESATAAAPLSKSNANSHSTTVTAHLSPAMQGKSTRDATAPADVITCTLDVQNPHGSTHQPGTVNVVSTLGCTSAVSSLSVNLYLYRNHTFVTQASTGNFGVKSLRTNAATAPCVVDIWQANGYGTIAFPPGYVPPTANVYDESGNILVVCPH